MKAILLFLTILTISNACLIQSPRSVSCSVDIVATSKSNWTSGGVSYTQHDITIQNTGVCEVVSITATLAAIPSISQHWNWEPSTGAFNLFGGLCVGGTSTSAGLVTAGPIPVSVKNLAVQCSPDCNPPCPTPPAYNDDMHCGEGFCAVTPDNFAGKEAVPLSLAVSLKTAPTELIRLSMLEDGMTTFDFYTATTGVQVGTGGTKVVADANNWPGIIGSGMSATRLLLQPCGLNVPYINFQGTSITVVLSGNVLTGFFLVDGDHFRAENITRGQITVVPKGAQRFEQNVGCTPAELVIVSNSEDGGVQTVAPTYFGTVEGVAAAGLGVRETVFTTMLHNLPQHQILGMQECRSRCGL